MGNYDVLRVKNQVAARAKDTDAPFRNESDSVSTLLPSMTLFKLKKAL